MVTKIFSGNPPPHVGRRVCPIKEKYQVCYDLYIKHELSCCMFPNATPISFPTAFNNVGKKLGYDDMDKLKSSFSNIENNASNESRRKNGNPIPHKEITELICSLTPHQWIYFDSEFNTCLLEDLDTTEAPRSYIETYYGDYEKDFLPVKMKNAERTYGVHFLDTTGFGYWLLHDGREFYKSLPSAERLALYADFGLMLNQGLFDHYVHTNK